MESYKCRPLGAKTCNAQLQIFRETLGLLLYLLWHPAIKFSPSYLALPDQASTVTIPNPCLPLAISSASL